ncbi:MAG: glycosyl transferase [Rhodobacteraceae bacterium]|nr:glycosyl transferase [Paracoccaceae bacterium]
MARIAYILLCHKDPEGIVRQARQLAEAGDFVAIHFDANAPEAQFRRIREGLDGVEAVTFTRKRLKCGWGEWSLVAATLLGVEAALAAFPDATHLYMLSGDCMAIKSHHYAHAFLDARDVDYIESFDFFTSGWIKTGLREERLIYRHYFNERNSKRLFYASFELQKRLGLARTVPDDLRVMIGSQWWCLRRATVEKLMAFLRERPDVLRFFRTTWIPDETFFQTLVRHLVPDGEIVSRTLTFLMFTDYGMPVNFYNDHYDLLLAQDYLFARKISPEATDLKKRLGDLYASDRTDFAISNEGRRLFEFLVGRGRQGRRFAPRFWERESTLGRDRELLVLCCKKWHVAKRLLAAAEAETGIRGVAYLFDEESTALPDLGGIQSTMAKRTRHRRAMMRVLLDYHGTDRMMICLDPGSFDILQDFYADRCTTRLLEIECLYSDDYLVGHTRRVGLAGEATSRATIEMLLPTVRHDFAYEIDRIRDAGFTHHHRISQRHGTTENAAEMAQFFDISEASALRLAETPYLFDD